MLRYFLATHDQVLGSLSDRMSLFFNSVDRGVNGVDALTHIFLKNKVSTNSQWMYTYSRKGFASVPPRILDVVDNFGR